MPDRRDGGNRPASAHRVPLVARVALAVVLFHIPLLVGVVADDLLPVSPVRISHLVAALVAVTLAVGLTRSLVLFKISRARWRARLRDLLPYLAPPAALGLLSAAAPGWHPTSATAIAGMAAFVAFDAIWFAGSVRRAVLAPADL